VIVSSSDGDGMMDDDGVVGCLVGEGVVVVDMVGGCGGGDAAGVEIGGGIVATVVVVDAVVVVEEGRVVAAVEVLVPPLPPSTSQTPTNSQACSQLIVTPGSYAGCEHHGVNGNSRHLK
jgi:hypothetical protein